jgi:hypothetical protein
MSVPSNECLQQMEKKVEDLRDSTGGGILSPPGANHHLKPPNSSFPNPAPSNSAVRGTELRFRLPNSQPPPLRQQSTLSLQLSRLSSPALQITPDRTLYPYTCEHIHRHERSTRCKPRLYPSTIYTRKLTTSLARAPPSRSSSSPPAAVTTPTCSRRSSRAARTGRSRGCSTRRRPSWGTTSTTRPRCVGTVSPPPP